MRGVYLDLESRRVVALEAEPEFRELIERAARKTDGSEGMLRFAHRLSRGR